MIYFRTTYFPLEPTCNPNKRTNVIYYTVVGTPECFSDDLCFFTIFHRQYYIAHSSITFHKYIIAFYDKHVHIHHGTIVQAGIRKSFYKSLLNSPYLWIRARLAVNKKQIFLVTRSPTDNLILAFGFFEKTNKE